MINRKKLLQNIAFYSFFFGVYVFYKHFVLNDQLIIKDILIKYGITLLIGLFLEVYTRLMTRFFKVKNIFQSNRLNFRLLLKTILIIGIITFGIAFGTFLLLIFIFLLDNKIERFTQVIYIYVTSLTAGAIFSIGIFASLITYKNIKNKNGMKEEK
ncbi:MAG: hypothetical protein LBH43_01985 [Treponema sp.]|nr:hypothetical protein [Treponema sp.]